MIPEIMIYLNRSGRVTSKDDVLRVAAELSNVVMHPLQSLVDIENAKVLRLFAVCKLGGVRVGPKTLTSVEANKDDAFASKVLTNQLRIAT